MDTSFALVITVLGLTFGVLMPLIIGYFSYKEKHLKLQRDLANAGGEGMRTELENLRQRVAVLERLATSEDKQLAGEIERLRREDTGLRST